MRFSLNWLRALVDVPVDAARLAQRLTMSGLEVSAVDVEGAALDGVIVGRIVGCEPHPTADRLRVCRVDTGGGEMQIVCGAPNARVGVRAPLATVGAKLPNGATIGALQLRGVESCGMLCSAQELGLGSDRSGLMELPADAPVGEPLAACLGLPDTVIEIELTPNRGDCLGMIGLAAEVAAELGTRPRSFEVAPVAPVVRAPRGIRLDAGAACPRYLGRAVRGVRVGATTPLWMGQRLRAAGVKTINAVVDVTNYVMLETGQPLHAFDEAELDGALLVRYADGDKTLQLLDGGEVHLDPTFLVIADQRQVLAVAGVMGGFASRVTAATRDVFLEAAHFAPAAIAGRARRLGLATDAAFRFERGVDPEAPRMAIERATALLCEIAGGQAGEVVEAVSPEHLPRRHVVSLRRTRIARVLGAPIADADAEQTLSALGMDVQADPLGWRVVPPSRRFDIEREEDLIEEVARIHGYDRIPARLPSGAPPAPHDDGSRLPASVLGTELAARGYHEAVCYAFVDPQLLSVWRLGEHAVRLANPLSAELGAMRTSLLPGLVAALRRNGSRQRTRVRLFESGVVFERGDWGPGSGDGKATAPAETSMLAATACGSAHREQWGTPERALDFFDIKGDLESLIQLSGTARCWSFDGAELPAWLHPGRGARVVRDGVPVGAVGALHPALQRGLDLPETYAFEIRLDALRARAIPVAHAPPRFPSLRRDVAVEVEENVRWAQIAAAIHAALPTVLRDLILFDCFRGPGLRPGHKSLAIGLILQSDSRTLTDLDADGSVATVVAMLENNFAARLRG